VWFYGTGRYWGVNKTVAGSYEDADPNPFRYVPDLSRQGVDDGHIRSFADSFRKYIAPLHPALIEAANLRAVKQTTLPDGSPAMLVGKSGFYDFGPSTIDSLVLCAAPIDLPSGLTFTRDLYCAAGLNGGDANVFRAVLSDGDVVLGDQSTVLRWMHATGAISTGRRSQMYGRLSSETRITLGCGCAFERVNAPVILVELEEVPEHLRRASIYGKRSIMDFRLGRLRANGDFHLAAGDMLQGHVIAAGAVSADDGTRVVGSIKSHRGTHIGANAEIHGTLASAADMQIGKGCYVRGPVLAEGELVIGAGTQIGCPESPTTVSAPKITIAPGAVIYGSLWARTTGRVQG
jgi:cytoskeletal protein CcmA (bactofilin family)